ncbi:MAG TPA: L,D-transpeptidase [Candidatus Paceibacterota bacterium]|nr:L,D-transpeptidase [Candidatus Paceibacterota bacterium]
MHAGFSAAFAAAVIGFSSCCAAQTPSLVVRVDRRTQELHISVGTKTGTEERYVWRVSTARTPYATPPGIYRPTWMDPRHFSKEYDHAPMPWAVFYDGGRALHGVEAAEVRHLGKPASHGCVRMTAAHAHVFYDLVRRYGMRRTYIVIQ